MARVLGYVLGNQMVPKGTRGETLERKKIRLKSHNLWEDDGFHVPLYCSQISGGLVQLSFNLRDWLERHKVGSNVIGQITTRSKREGFTSF